MAERATPSRCSPVDLATWQARLMKEEFRWPPYMPLGSAIRAKRDKRFQAFLRRAVPAPI